MIARNLLPILILAVVTGGCKLFKSSTKGLTAEDAIWLDTMNIDLAGDSALPYRPAPDIEIDIHHLALDLRFDWPEEKVMGKASLSVSAYFDAVDSIRLDARGFLIDAIALRDKAHTYTPQYLYDGKEIVVLPAAPLKATDTILLEITYVAQPAKLEITEGTAIESNQGLYFINTKGETPGKPKQVWSQGEPECNSGWFPSVDHPHEKFTQEILLTVDSAYKTVSNGRLAYSTLNSDGTRTDCWKQDLPHSNYLVMIAMGEFEVVKDKWNDLDVAYYLDKEYKPYADDIFGNTPEMLTFYSELLDYPYPWDKFYQVVVKDFVSGAMENTSAVIHGDFVQLTDRELLDDSHEDVVAHELFHHWFGDLVSCKTWSQITLNEGFATYGEYLWKHHKYGAEEARLHLLGDLHTYLEEAVSPKQLIRYHYLEPDEVFDRHSYQKGARVLHMLRQEVGDSAFFTSLRQYLKAYAFQSVEIDDLRQAFEKTTGKDLKWFFDQWYLDKGHPYVVCAYSWAEETSELSLSVVQLQSSDMPTFKFHVPLTICFEDGSIFNKTLWVDETVEAFSLPLDQRPSWYALDLFGDMLWEMEESKEAAVWERQLLEAEAFISRYRAMEQLTALNPDFLVEKSGEILKDPFWYMRQTALDYFTLVQREPNKPLQNKALELSTQDKSSLVRASAYILLDSLTKTDTTFEDHFVKGLRDSSYTVIESCLAILLERNACRANDAAAFLEKEKYGHVRFWVSRVYAACADPENLGYFDSVAAASTGLDLFLINNDFVNFAKKLDREEVYDHLARVLGKSALADGSWWAKYSAFQGLHTVLDFYEREITALESMKEMTPDQVERLAGLRNKKAALAALIDEISAQSEEMEIPSTH